MKSVFGEFSSEVSICPSKVPHTDLGGASSCSDYIIALHSQVDYGIIAWRTAASCHLQSISVVLNHAVW